MSEIQRHEFYDRNRFPTQGIRSEIPYQSLLRLHEEVETGNFSKPDENQETNTINLQLRLESVVLWLDICLKKKLVVSPKLVRFFYVQAVQIAVSLMLQGTE